MDHVLPTCMLRHVGTRHWRSKEQFQVEQDRYPFWQIIVVEEGHFEYKLPGISAEASKDDMVFLPSNTVFFRKAASKLRFLHIMFDLKSTVYPDSAIMRSFQRLLPEYRLSLRDFPRLHATLSYMKKLNKRAGPVSDDWLEHMVKDLWITFCLDMEEQGLAGTHGSKEDSLMEYVKQAIESQAYGPLSLRSLAHEVQLSPIQLTRRFHAIYRMPPMRYVTQLRLERAKSLLVEGDASVESIAHVCGYENGLYFSRIFSQHIGLSPTQYRKLFRI
jgi:AraC family transcriptional regulator